jgi:hypothetical protein
MKTIEGFKLRKIGCEYIIVGEGLGQVSFNKILLFSPSAAMLWQHVEGKDFDADTLTDLLTTHYEVDEQTAQLDAQVILCEWQKAKIVE